MIFYIILLCIVVFLAYFGRRYCSSDIRRLSLFLVGILLVLFAGLRDRSVGTDTANYVSWLDSIDSLERALVFPIELGYSLLVLLSGSFSEGYVVLLILTAILVVSLYMTTIVRLSERYEIAIFSFIALGFYTFFFNGARQGIAAGICFFALPWLLKRKAVPYFFLVLFATFFHKTALIAAPLYFLASDRVGWRQLLYVAGATVLFSAGLSVFAEFAASLIDVKYATYGQAGDGGGKVNVAFLIGQGLIFLLFKKQANAANSHYSSLLNIYLIGLVPALASVVGSVNPSGVLRLTVYFSHAAILLWPMIFLSFRNYQSRAIMFLGFVMVSVAYFYLTTSSFSDLTPYRLNLEVFQ